jgi:hypothetical protein
MFLALQLHTNAEQPQLKDKLIGSATLVLGNL